MSPAVKIWLKRIWVSEKILISGRPCTYVNERWSEMWEWDVPLMLPHSVFRLYLVRQFALFHLLHNSFRDVRYSYMTMTEWTKEPIWSRGAQFRFPAQAILTSECLLTAPSTIMTTCHHQRKQWDRACRGHIQSSHQKSSNYGSLHVDPCYVRGRRPWARGKRALTAMIVVPMLLACWKPGMTPGGVVWGPAAWTDLGFGCEVIAGNRSLFCRSSRERERERLGDSLSLMAMFSFTATGARYCCAVLKSGRAHSDGIWVQMYQANRPALPLASTRGAWWYNPRLMHGCTDARLPRLAARHCVCIRTWVFSLATR